MGRISSRSGTPWNECVLSMSCRRRIKEGNKNCLYIIKNQILFLSHLLLPVIELVPRGIPVTQVRLSPDARLPQCARKRLACLVDIGTPLVARLRRDPTRDDDDLYTCHAWGEYEPLVVAMGH